VLLIDNTEADELLFNQPLLNAVTQFADCDMVPYYDVPATGPDGYDAVILSGVPLHYSFDTIDDRKNRLHWLKNTDVPVLGICLGHQAIGGVFEAAIKDNEAEVGDCSLQVLAEDLIFEDFGDEFTIKTNHRASITLPYGFRQLASSATCRNQIMKHNSKDIYGVQFHPESSVLGQVLIKNFFDIVAARVPSVEKLPNLMLDDPLMGTGLAAL
jgi:GMP synthase (glutamine-hydrolysing)